MKNKAVFTTVLLALISTIAFGQAVKIDTVYENTKRAQSVYFEVLGNGITYSFNYDTRFRKKQTGEGMRVGLSYLSTDGVSFFSLPVVFNYLAGKDGKYFEIGAGATFYSASSDEFLFTNNNSSKNRYSSVMGTMTFGYRRQPVDSGYMFRAGVAPVLSQGDFIPYWPYVSFGYKF